MKNLIGVLAVVAIFMISCGDTTPKVDPNAALVNGLNAQLEKVPLEGAFDYKSAQLKQNKVMDLADKVAPVVKEVIAKLPQGYVLVIIGHANVRGPACATATKKGNVYWSEERAKAVYQALKDKGITSDKLVYMGAGEDPAYLKEGVDKRSDEQIRVTFKIMSKENYENEKQRVKTDCTEGD